MTCAHYQVSVCTSYIHINNNVDVMSSAQIKPHQSACIISYLWCLSVPLGFCFEHLSVCWSVFLTQNCKWIFTGFSVLWRCWLGGRNGIQPVKHWVVGVGVVICLERGAGLHMAQLMPLPLTVSCFSEIQIGFTFWYRLTWVVLEKGR